MITGMRDEYGRELNEFLCKYNAMKEHFIAWIPDDPGQIEELDKSGFHICVENGRIVGCLGAYLSLPQKLARLLGPIIAEGLFDRYVDELYRRLLHGLPDGVEELRIAFLAENVLCRSWCERTGFALYNAETTIALGRSRGPGASQQDASFDIRPYEPAYRDGLAAVHPAGTFLTLDELVEGVGERRRLLLALDQNDVAGYVCFESAANGPGEILLLHVRADRRGQGFGTALLRRAVRLLWECGAKEIRISVRTENHGAHRLYLLEGFEDRETVIAYRKRIKPDFDFPGNVNQN